MNWLKIYYVAHTYSGGVGEWGGRPDGQFNRASVILPPKLIVAACNNPMSSRIYARDEFTGLRPVNS